MLHRTTLLAVTIASAAYVASCRTSRIEGDDDELRKIAAELAASEVTKPTAPLRISSAADSSSERLPTPSPPSRCYPPRTLELLVHLDGAPSESAASRRITRANDRVHVADGRREEWLFVRNVRDAAHFAATRVLHDERELVDHPMAELQRTGIAASWDAIACFGIGSKDLERLRPTGATRLEFGLEFRHLAAEPTSHPGGIVELWWNDAHAIPLELVAVGASGRVISRTTALELAIDERLLGEPAVRFPDYALFDVSDWREALHDH